MLRWALRAIGLAVTAYAGWALWRFPWGDAGAALGHANWGFLAVAVVATVLSVLARGWEWHLLLLPAAENRLWTAERASLLGAAVGNVSVSVAGEGARVKYIADRDGVPPGLATAAVVWSRFLQMAAGLALVVVVPYFTDIPARMQAAHTVASVLLAAGLCLYLFRSRIPSGLPVPAFVRRPLDAMRTIHREGPKIPAALALACVHWAMQYAAYHLVLLSSGIDAGFAATFAAVVIANVAWLLRFTPGNIGVMQGSIALALLPFGVDPARAVVASLILQAVQLLPLIPIAALAVGLHHFTAVFGGTQEAHEQPA